MDYVTEGQRLAKVSICPEELFELMLKCWKNDPAERPNFKEALDFLVGIRGEETQTRIYEQVGGDSSYYKATDDYNREALFETHKPEYQQEDDPEYQHTNE
jgi:hypothetical protein